uniref:RING-type domain-containing protein n=1 Tax=Meloidogyne floridensis TaxID=298350 RepID=A0A915NTA3_9BILA
MYLFKIFISTILLAKLCNCAFQLFNTERQYEFHGLVTPNLNKMGKPIIWYIQMICRQGCNSHSKYYSTITPDTVIDAGKFSFNLMAAMKKQGGFEEIRLLAVNISSLDEISNKYRFGHFESNSETGFYLEFKFNEGNKLPLTTLNKNSRVSFNSRVSYVNYNARIKAKQNGWFKSTKIFGFKEKLTNAEIEGRKSFRIYIGGDNARININKASFWPFSSSKELINLEPIDKYLRENSLPSMELIIEQDYFHRKCILELLGAQTTHDIEWKNDALYDTIAAEIRRRQYRHELKMPILQNGENPVYTYKFDPTITRQKEYNKIDCYNLQRGQFTRTKIYFLPLVPKSQRQYEFHLRISPNIRTVGTKLLPIVWIVQLDCLIGCNKYLDTQILQTQNFLENAGKVVFYLLASPVVNGEGYEDITNLKIKITSLDKLAGKYRTYTWENVVPEFGKEHHFQFGHYESNSELGLYLQFKFDLNYFSPLILNKNEVGARPLKYKAKLIATGWFCNKYSSKIFGNIIELPDSSLEGETFQIPLGGTNGIVPLKRRSSWPFSLLNCIKEEKVNIIRYLQNNTFPSMELIIEQMPVCGICGEKNYGEVVKLSTCEHYFHIYCINNSVKKSGTKQINKNEISEVVDIYISSEHRCSLCLRGFAIDKKTQLVNFDNQKIQYRQFRHYLKMPILQNGENPTYTYKIGLDNKQRNYNIMSILNFGDSDSESPPTIQNTEIAPSKGKKPIEADIEEINIRKTEPFGEGSSKRAEVYNDEEMSLYQQFLRGRVENEGTSSRNTSGELGSIKSPISPGTFERVFKGEGNEVFTTENEIEEPVEKKSKLTRWISRFFTKQEKQEELSEEDKTKSELMENFLSNIPLETIESGDELSENEVVELKSDEQMDDFIREQTDRLKQTNRLLTIPEITEDELSSSPLIRKRNKNIEKEQSSESGNKSFKSASGGQPSNNYIPPDRKSTTNSSSASLNSGRSTPPRYALSKEGSSVQSNSPIDNGSPTISINSDNGLRLRHQSSAKRSPLGGITSPNNQILQRSSSSKSVNNFPPSGTSQLSEQTLTNSSSGKESTDTFVSTQTHFSSERGGNVSPSPSPLPSDLPSPHHSAAPSPHSSVSSSPLHHGKAITSYAQNCSISPLLIRKPAELQQSTAFTQIYTLPSPAKASRSKQSNSSNSSQRIQSKETLSSTSSSSQKTHSNIYFNTTDNFEETKSSDSSSDSDKSVVIEDNEINNNTKQITTLSTPFYTPLNTPLNDPSNIALNPLNTREIEEIGEEEINYENENIENSTGEETPLIGGNFNYGNKGDKKKKQRGYSATELNLDLKYNLQKLKDKFTRKLSKK